MIWPQWKIRHIQTVADDCLKRELIDEGWRVLFTMENQGDTRDTLAVPESWESFEAHAAECEKRGFSSHVQYVRDELATAIARLQSEIDSTRESVR